MLTFDEVPPVLFKYLPAKHAQNLLAHGAIRIGTLGYYRHNEDSRRGDTEEGKSTVYSDDPILHWRTEADQHPFHKMFIDMQGSTDVLVSGVGFQLERAHPDAYVYCVSSVLSQNLARSFGCDACVRINEPQAFFASITEHIRDHVRSGRVAPCSYQERRRRYSEAPLTDLCLIKEPRDSWQQEVRAMWIPRSSTIDFLDITVPGLARHCSRVEAA